MLIESLADNAARIPGDLAVIDDTGRYTFAQVGALAAAVMAAVKATTAREKVAIILPAGVGWVAGFYGTLAAGKAVVPVNFLLGAREIAHVLADAEVDTVISTAAWVEKLSQGTAKDLKLIDVSALTPLPPADPAVLAAPAPHAAGDLAVLMYTSGTSGLPKGVRLTYGNLDAGVSGCIRSAGLERSHVFLGLVPLFHSFGMAALMLAPMQLGATVVYQGRFSPVACLNAVREHRVSLLFGVPSMFAAIGRLKSATPADFAGMYAMISGGEPLPAAVRELYRDRFNATLYEGYGLTETAPVLSFNRPGHNRPGSVGLAQASVTVRILPENSTPPSPGSPRPPPGTEGEVQVKGPMVFSGYHNLPDATRDAFTPDGYFRTGDLGKLDPDGYLFITGRLKDLIIVSGEKCHPREIEEVLALHPAVAEVAVLGRKDEGRGEVPFAFVVAKEGQTLEPTDLRTFARDHGLVGWKIPKDILIVKELPRSPTGKVLKRELAKQIPL